MVHSCNGKEDKTALNTEKPKGIGTQSARFFIRKNLNLDLHLSVKTL
ncbi:hypothetical protein [Okeania sp. SIO3I5]|nr:hypothetical protein [Okeania sp. SIO3I5]